MKKFLPLIAVAMLCLSVSTANAQVDFIFSTSSTDASAGSEIDVADGGSASLFLFVDNADSSGDQVDGISLDFSNAGSANLIATSLFFEGDNGDGTNSIWNFGTTQGTLNPGDQPNIIVDDSNAASFANPSGGIQNGVGPVLYATLNFDASVVGTNTLGLIEGPQLISVGGAEAEGGVTLGTATVNVVSPDVVPEPSSLALVGSIFGAALLRRRRRN